MISEPNNSVGDIAIIGMALRFPQSQDVETFWNNISQAKELITFFSEEELQDSGVSSNHLKDPNYIKAKGYLEDVEYLDCEFFGYNEREASIIDPQHRLLLTCAWEALEYAGYNPYSYQGTIGLFAGCNNNNYFLKHIFPNISQDNLGMQDEMLILVGNSNDYLATRISFKLNLRGPSKTIQTACSTSLAAVHDACQSLINYECDMMLAGGASVSLPLKQGYFYTQEGIYSPDGHCRAFDENGAGTCFGDGVGVVLLKRLEDALKDKDTIHAVIKGSALNNDGSNKMSYFAPSVSGQAEAIASAIASSGIDAESISYIEAHGTGTHLGDPIEISALTEVFRYYTSKKQFCAIGSVKTNLGHLVNAAGIAGLIKTILSLKHKQIPPSLHFNKSNQQIDFQNSPFYVNTELKKWNHNNEKLRAGVSSFGIGGTNVHVILEEAPLPMKYVSDWSYYALPYSAQHPLVFKNLLVQSEESGLAKDQNIANIAYTLQVGRENFSYKTYFLGKNKEEILSQLKNYNCQNSLPTQSSSKISHQIWIFSFDPEAFSEPLYQDKLPAFFDPVLKQLQIETSGIFKEGLLNLLSNFSSPNTYESYCKCFLTGLILAKSFLLCHLKPDEVTGIGIGELIAATFAELFTIKDALLILRILWEISQDVANKSDKEKKELLNQYFEKIYIKSPTFHYFSALQNHSILSKISWIELFLTQKKDPFINLKETSSIVHIGTNPCIKMVKRTPYNLQNLQKKEQLPLNSIEFLFLKTVLESWRLGRAIDWSVFYPKETPYRIPLLTYPFHLKRCWLKEQKNIPREKQTSNDNIDINFEKKDISLIHRLLILCWQDSLKKDDIRIDDDFFDIGGDSLAAIDTIQLINKHFKTNFSLNNLHTYRTIQLLAKAIEENP